MNVENFIGDCYELMHDLVEHHGKEVQMVLVNKKDEDESLAYAYGKEEESLIEIRPHTKEKEAVWSIPEWDFNFDNYFFEQIENDYEIGMITPQMHSDIWNSLNELFPTELNNLEGVQKYLKYCLDNGITKGYLEKELKTSINNAMQYYGMEPLELNDIFEYKGYIAQVDDLNYDEPRESIVYIYLSKQDMIDGNCLSKVSLRNDDMKNYIKEYIEDNFIDHQLEQEDKQYVTFVLGYDLLRDMTYNSSSPECDTNYDFCMGLAEKFINSDYYKDNSKSTYDLLVQWITDNKTTIQQDYNNFIGIDDKKTRTLENGIYVMNLGFRKDQPIALVEKTIGDNRQYIVAFNYQVKDNKMDWAYAYYYDNNKDKAIEDFKKVTSGGNLVNTFKEKNDER